MQIHECFPSFTDEMRKLASRKKQYTVKSMLPAVTLGGALIGLGAGILKSKNLPKAQRLKHVVHATTLGTGLGWLPDVAYSGTKSLKRTS